MVLSCIYVEQNNLLRVSSSHGGRFDELDSLCSPRAYIWVLSSPMRRHEGGPLVLLVNQVSVSKSRMKLA